jgi:hypothetical protein
VLGFEEAWIGEHFTAAWEPCPAPDLLIAQALLRTKRIRLGPLSHLLPFHHPVELAHRVAYLDHMAEGRYQVGVGIGVLPTDHSLFALDASHGRNRRMTFEAIDMMTQLWIDGQPGRHMGHFATKVIVVSENVDISDNDKVVWAFASRSHPTYGTYLRPEWDSYGSGLEAYHSVNENFSKEGGGAVIYSCLPIEERTGLKVPMIMSFEENYSEPLKEKVIADMKRWGFG